MAYDINSFYNLLGQLDGREFIESYISYNAALISSKVKPSITLTIKKNSDNKIYNLWRVHGIEALNNLNLESVLLREGNDFIILLIYNRDLLYKFLNKEENRAFLEELGYEFSEKIESSLYKLVERYGIYKCPHELGIFLGYPIDDVKGFINCSRSECIFCGYWKVYKNEERARELFKLFDNIKNITIEKLMSGKKGKEVSLYLTNEFAGKITI